MMNLSEYRTKSARLADFLPWVCLVAEGVVLNKDGSFQRTARFRGPDLDSATPAELVAVTARLNSALRRLGSGWAVFVEAQRVPAVSYPVSDFPDVVSELVDVERREQFREEGVHFESFYYLTLLWMPPAEEAARVEAWLYEGRSKTGVDPKELLKSFIDRTGRMLHLVEGFMPEAEWLGDGETLTYLHSCVSTKTQRVRVPETPAYLDALLADEALVGGLEPRLGDHHLRTLTITGSGTLTLSGTNTYSGGTTINAGTLTGTTTSLQGAITDDAALVFNQSSTGTYAGVVSGTGSVTKRQIPAMARTPRARQKHLREAGPVKTRSTFIARDEVLREYEIQRGAMMPRTEPTR